MASPNTDFWSWRKHTVDFANKVEIKRLLRKYDPIWAIGLLVIAKDYMFVNQEISANETGAEILLAYCNDRTTEPQRVLDFFEDVVACGYFTRNNGSYQCPDVLSRYEEKMQISITNSKNREGKSKPTGGGKSEPQEQAAPPAESEPKPKKEKKKPEPEPDVELTTEGMALRSDVIAYTYDLDFNEDLIEMTNKEWNRIAERHGDDAELRCRFYYEWKASKIVNGKRFKNLDFHTINTASWINDKVYLSRRHNGKSNKQLTGAPLEPGTGRAALLHGD